jgi:hypothetical protein
MQVTVVSEDYDISEPKCTSSVRWGQEPGQRDAQRYDTFDVTFDVEKDKGKKEKVAVQLFFNGKKWNSKVSHSGWEVTGFDMVGRHLFAHVVDSEDLQTAFVICIHVDVDQ